MVKLLLWRHAKSDWDTPELDDHERPLNKRGRRDREIMARYIENNFAPTLVICSTARRTRETVVTLCNHDIITYSSDLYQAMHTDLLNIAKRNGGDHECILLVAHNPGMEMFAGRMAQTSPEIAERFATKYPTCSVACISWDCDWADISFDNGGVSDYENPSRLIRHE